MTKFRRPRLLFILLLALLSLLTQHLCKADPIMKLIGTTIEDMTTAVYSWISDGISSLSNGIAEVLLKPVELPTTEDFEKMVQIEQLNVFKQIALDEVQLATDSTLQSLKPFSGQLQGFLSSIWELVQDEQNLNSLVSLVKETGKNAMDHVWKWLTFQS